MKSLRLRGAFRIAHGSTQERRVLRLELDSARAEAPFVPYYNDREAAALEWLAARSFADLGDLVELKRRAEVEAAPRVVRTGLDVLRHDLEARGLGLPLWSALNLPDPTGVVGCRSLGIPTDLGEHRERVREATTAFRILKLKVGSGNLDWDEATVAVAREANPSGAMFVDANGGWGVEEALRAVRFLERQGIRWLEQPIQRELGREGWMALRRGLGESRVGLVADESVCDVADLRGLSECVDGVNVKLLKAGGISGALELIREARRLGKWVLLGCMIESSLGVTAAAHLAGCVDAIDLDGHLYLEEDDFEGLWYDGEGRVRIPAGYGIAANERLNGSSGVATPG